MSEPRDRWQRGLRLAQPPDPARLEAERESLRRLDQQPAARRWAGFLRLSGPGFLQSALTLGAGTASASLFAGAAFGYRLLWVAPLAMAIGVLLMAAVAHQTLSTGQRPLEAMRRYAGPVFAWGWVAGALITSILWHFPQYSLAAATLSDATDALGGPHLDPRWLGLPVLAWAILLSFSYGSSSRLVRVYEHALKLMVWLIVLSLALVVLRTGVDDWGALARGFLCFEIPDEHNGVRGVTVVLSGLSAAVGVNMVFLYPYSLLARGWGREHRRLARFDLLAGMFLPYVLATSLLVIASANTMYRSGSFQGTGVTPLQAAAALQAAAGPLLGRLVFDLGLLAMALSTISLHMVCTGFVCAEVFGWEIGSRKHRLAMLIPAPGVLGPVIWSHVAVWLAVPINIVCGLLLPLTWLGFVKLQRSRAYLGEDRPAGARGRLWLGAMVLAVAFLAAFLVWYLLTSGLDYLHPAR